MASRSCRPVMVAVFLLAVSLTAHGGDPDILADFINVPQGVAADANFFTFRGLRQSLAGASADAPFNSTEATQHEFPALAGQSVSVAALKFQTGGIGPPHIHPRSAELLIVVQGSLTVGLVDSTNKLYTQILTPGDVFVFPKGLVHFQIATDSKYPTVAISAFGCADAGFISIPKNVFDSGIDHLVLARSFKTDAETIKKLATANNG